MVIYNYDKKLERAERKLRESGVSERNREVIISFKEHCFAEGLSIGRVVKYLYILTYLAEWFGKDFDEVDRSDIERVVSKIQRVPIRN